MPYQVTCHLRSGEIIYNDTYRCKTNVSEFLNNIFAKNGDFMCQIVTPHNTNMLYYLYMTTNRGNILMISLDNTLGYGILIKCNRFIISPINEDEILTYVELFHECGKDKNKLINLLDKLHNRCGQIRDIITSVGNNTSPISSIKRSPKN